MAHFSCRARNSGMRNHVTATFTYINHTVLKVKVSLTDLKKKHFCEEIVSKMQIPLGIFN